MFSFNIKDSVKYFKHYIKTVILAFCYMIVFIIIGLITIKEHIVFFALGLIAGTVLGLIKLILTYEGISKALDIDFGKNKNKKLMYYLYNILSYILILVILVLFAYTNRYLLIGTIIGVFFVYISMLSILFIDVVVRKKDL